MKKVIKIKNLHCAGCALELEDEIREIKEVEEVTVDFVTQTITLTASDDGIKKAIKKANKFENVRVVEDETETKKTDVKPIILISVAFLLFIIGLVLSNTVKVASVIVYMVAYLTVGYPVLISTAKNVIKGRVFDENFLMTIASVGAFCLGEFSEGVLVMLLYQTGEWLQALAVGSSRKSIGELMALKSDKAYLMQGDDLLEVAPEELKIGDRILVKAGEKLPVDGKLLSKVGTFDVKSLTGESELKYAEKGEEVLSGSISIAGAVQVEVVRLYQDSAVGKILELVENAGSKRAKPEKFISKFAKYYTPIVCGLALLTVVFAPPISGLLSENRFFYKDFARWVRSALTFLVISCPCALVISVPLTYFSGIGACAKKGVLVKGATYLDTLANANIFAFDKTGTLTEGAFKILSVQPAESVTEKELLEMVASVEISSNHPLAKAFDGFEKRKTEKLEEVAGLGLTAEIDGKTLLVGSAKLLKEKGIDFIENKSVNTIVYVAREKEYLGSIELGDKLRSEAKETIEKLKEEGVERFVLLTGDREERARKTANEVGVYEINANLLPQEKLKEAEELKENGELVYVGDGINDAPVMKCADCAVSMGKLGSAAAVEASDLVLIADNLKGLVWGKKIAKRTQKIVLENIVFSVAMKVAFMAFGLFGILPLSLAVFADVGVMLLAVLNSFRAKIQ